jgi:aspartate/methionine/tyrosine aminotransferase
MHEPARQAAAASLTAELGVDFAAADVFLTRGASGAVVLASQAVVEAGDEVVFLSPPWFFTRLWSSRAAPRRSAFARAVIVNTTHNPTGRIHAPAALERLADKRAKAAVEYGSPIWIISDEGTAALCSTVVDFSVPLSSIRIRCLLTPTARARWHQGNGSVFWPGAEPAQG